MLPCISHHPPGIENIPPSPPDSCPAGVPVGSPSTTNDQRVGSARRGQSHHVVVTTHRSVSTHSFPRRLTRSALLLLRRSCECSSSSNGGCEQNHGADGSGRSGREGAQVGGAGGGARRGRASADARGGRGRVTPAFDAAGDDGGGGGGRVAAGVVVGRVPLTRQAGGGIRTQRPNESAIR